MALYLYTYLNLFGYVGSDTPEDPGGDFGMSVWIEAPDEQAALNWGHLVLGDHIRARHRHDGSAPEIDPGGIEEWIEKDDAVLKGAEGRFPLCRVGEIPVWEAPWRRHNARPPSEPSESEGAR